MLPGRYSYANPAEATGNKAIGGEAALWSEFINNENLERSVNKQHCTALPAQPCTALHSPD